MTLGSGKNLTTNQCDYKQNFGIKNEAFKGCLQLKDLYMFEALIGFLINEISDFSASANELVYSDWKWKISLGYGAQISVTKNKTLVLNLRP